MLPMFGQCTEISGRASPWQRAPAGKRCRALPDERDGERAVDRGCVERRGLRDRVADQDATGLQLVPPGARDRSELARRVGAVVERDARLAGVERRELG